MKFTKTISGLCLVFALIPSAASAQISLNQVRDAARSYTETASENGLAADAIEKVRELAGSFGWRDQSQSRSVGDALAALNADQSLDALKHLDRLRGMRLTAEQMDLFKDAKRLVDVYVLQAELDDGASSGVLGRAVSAIKEGNYKDALPHLRQLMEQAELSEEQEEALGDLVKQYQEWAEEES